MAGVGNDLVCVLPAMVEVVAGLAMDRCWAGRGRGLTLHRLAATWHTGTLAWTATPTHTAHWASTPRAQDIYTLLQIGHWRPATMCYVHQL